RGCARDRRDRNRARASLSRPRSRATPARLRRRNAAGASGRPAHGLGARACRHSVHRDCRRRRGLVDAPGAGGPRDRRRRPHAGALRDRVRDRRWPREAAVRGWRHGEPQAVRGPLVAVVGGGTCTPQEAAWATAVGRLIAERGAVLLCGGLGGVMAAAARGAKQAGGLTVGILPGNDPREANPDIDVALATGMGEMRNALIVRAASAVIAIGGGWGTLSEIAMARRIETPV